MSDYETARQQLLTEIALAERESAMAWERQRDLERRYDEMNCKSKDRATGKRCELPAGHEGRHSHLVKWREGRL